MSIRSKGQNGKNTKAKYQTKILEELLREQQRDIDQFKLEAGQKIRELLKNEIEYLEEIDKLKKINAEWVKIFKQLKKEMDIQLKLQETAVPENECTICFAECDKHVALVPCGHSSFCEGCAENVLKTNNKCPICQANVENKVRIY